MITYSPKATPLMLETAARLQREGTVQVRGLYKRGSRAVMRLFLERETQRSVSLLALGDTAIYSFN